MKYRVNFLMTAYEMFTLWGGPSGNDLDSEVKKQFCTDVEQNSFSEVISNSSDMKDLPDLEDIRFDDLCGQIDNDITEGSRFWKAVTIQHDSLFVDWSDSGTAEDILSYYIDIVIDEEKLLTLYPAQY